MIAGGMCAQALAITLFLAPLNVAVWFVGAVMLGVGTAMVYPTLLAAIGDVVDPLVRASSIGVYRLWRDSGYAFGALLSGIVAHALGQDAAIAVVAAVTLASGVIVGIRMRETRPRTAKFSPQGAPS
jgi:MFS family permease